MSDVEVWARARLRAAEGVVLSAILARVDYVGWNAEQDPRDKRATVAEVNRAVAGAGGARGFVKAGRKRVLIFRGIELLPLPERRAWRAASLPPAELVEDARVLEALGALHDHGLVRGPRTLDIAFLRLAASPDSRLCLECGLVTRHEDALHRSCARRRRRRLQGRKTA